MIKVEMIKCWVVIDESDHEVEIGGVFLSYDDAVEFIRTKWTDVEDSEIDEHIRETVLKERKENN